MDLGANKTKTFVNVTLPIIFPGILSGALLAFTLSIDDVIISSFTAGPRDNDVPDQGHAAHPGGHHAGR